MRENDSNVTILDFIRSDGYITLNKKLAHAIGLNEVIIYSELVSRYLYFKERDKLENGYFFNTIEDLEEATTLSRHQQPKVIKNLCNLNLIDCQLKGIPAKRYFKINEDIEVLNKIIPQFTENRQTSKRKTSKQENRKADTNNNNYNTKQESKSIGCSTSSASRGTSSTFDFSILEKQIRKCYDEDYTTMSIDDVIEVFRYFTSCHSEYCGFEHPKLTNKTVTDIIERISSCGDMGFDLELDSYYAMIDFYWTQAKNRNFKGNERTTINYSIAHFMSDEIRTNCFYKTRY